MFSIMLSVLHIRLLCAIKSFLLTYVLTYLYTINDWGTTSYGDMAHQWNCSFVYWFAMFTTLHQALLCLKMIRWMMLPCNEDVLLYSVAWSNGLTTHVVLGKTTRRRRHFISHCASKMFWCFSIKLIICLYHFGCHNMLFIIRRSLGDIVSTNSRETFDVVQRRELCTMSDIATPMDSQSPSADTNKLSV